MEFDVLKTIVDNKIEQFILEYRNAIKLFENYDVRNKLIHPGEYGTYKENLCKELLSFSIPNKYQVASGFIYNSKKEMTTQCDVVLFDYNNTPFMSLDDKNRFFPNETVLAIGEIKSTITKDTLAKTLIKLAKNKDIRKISSSLYSDGERGECDTSRFMYDGIFTFVICDSISDYTEDIASYIKEQYNNAGIEIYNRHNVIVSLKNGLITYKSGDAINRKLNIKDNIFIPFPQWNEEVGEQDGWIFVGSEIDILKQFIIHINNYLINTRTYYPEPNLYLV